MADSNSGVLCPILAEEQIIISADNVDSLLLSTYQRSVGIEVIVTCLSPTHGLTGGSRTLVCGEDGQWSAAIPQCVDKRLIDENGDILNATTQVPPSITGTYSYEMLPYIVALCLLGLACFMLIILLSYALFDRRKRPHSDSSSGIFDGSRSSGGTVNSQTEFWVEMAGSRSFQCHELAQSRDSMVDIVGYTQLHPDWSGY